ncbi:6-phosphogluconate dehydrogenase C-terminal domain-like protein [Roridomyces roridus]|uniref:6-phosphogluconate dehydrogenase C-terminal domain-like protein n=1 Tax=Roridomyces roridus TaxID=1738132 RepID=A0AAD7FL01_9AGAR|nr:6-phosphogluconate dehydrogenase C-terminal domain-like protein [Roridomyces roridus]
MTPFTSTARTLGLIAPGAMGAALAARLSSFGAGSILTNLEGRSQATRERAAAANMVHATYADIVARATCIYSVVPPSDAFATAQSVVDAYKSTASDRSLIFVDCNAVNPESAKQLAALFEGTRITFLDGAIIGTPPTDTFNPAIYVCADPKDAVVLDDFTAMSIKYGLNVVPLKGKDAKIGDASAVKMAHAGIVKGAIGLFTTMILAANASSPSTAEGLLHALNFSQPTFVDQIIRLLPHAPPKAYRFVCEMEEVGAFVGESGGSVTYEGISEIFARVAESQEHPVPGGDVELLMKFVEEAQKLRAEK